MIGVKSDAGSRLFALTGNSAEGILILTNPHDMKPIEFDEQNVVFAENQDEYQNLPAHLVDEPEGRVIFCESLSFSERIRVLFTGRIWCSLMTFKQPLQPSFFTTKKTELFGGDDE